LTPNGFAAYLPEREGIETALLERDGQAALAGYPQMRTV
jgi:hypothetical protein